MCEVILSCHHVTTRMVSHFPKSSARCKGTEYTYTVTYGIASCGVIQYCIYNFFSAILWNRGKISDIKIDHMWLRMGCFEGDQLWTNLPPTKRSGGERERDQRLWIHANTRYSSSNRFPDDSPWDTLVIESALPQPSTGNVNSRVSSLFAFIL